MSYRIGIVGCGFGTIAHLPALHHHPQFDVVAIASPNTAAAAAAKHGIKQSFASCEEMLAGCDLDAVAIVSPPYAHESAVVAAVKAGKHVLCEEPFGLSVAAAQAMADAANAAGTACGIACDLRFVPQAGALKALVGSGRLSPLREIKITWLRPTLRSTAERPRGWAFERERGGGMAGGMLSHLIDQAIWLAGRSPLRSVGLTRIANPTRTDAHGLFTSSTDDGAFALLDFGEGLVARLTADGTTALHRYNCTMYGETISLAATGPNITELKIFVTEDEGTDEIACKPSLYERYAFNSNIPPLMEIYDEFAKKIEGQPNILPTFEEALQTQRVLAAIGYTVA